jgi:hypothetical protein
MEQLAGMAQDGESIRIDDSQTEGAFIPAGDDMLTREVNAFLARHGDGVNSLIIKLRIR